MNDFLSPQEKIQLQKVLGKSFQLRTPNERIEFLRFCGLEKYSGLVQIEQPLDRFFIALYNQLSNDYVENGQKLALVVFLEYLIELDSSLSPDDKSFIEYVINKSKSERGGISSEQQENINNQDVTEMTQMNSQNTFCCVVTGGLKASPLALKLAEAIGYELIKRGHILLNGGAEGIDKAAVEGANIYRQEVPNFNGKIVAYRPQKEPQTYNHLFTEVQIIGENRAERRDAIARRADVLIILSGSKGTIDYNNRALNYGKPIIPVGCSGGTALDIWHKLKADNGTTFSYRKYLSNTDIDSLNPSPNKVVVEDIASVAVKLAEKLCIQFKSIDNAEETATSNTTQEYQKTSIKASNLVTMSKPSKKILHLSDLHFGTSEQAKLWSGQLIEDLQQNLDINQLDALILSGDIANKSTPEEYKVAEEFLDEFIKDFPLKPEQITIVPGNHDLNWGLSKKAYTLKEKDECEPDKLQEGCYIPVTDDVVRVLNPEKYPQRFTNFKAFYDNYKANIKEYQLDSEQQYSLDIIGNNILILGLNSACELDHHYKARATINNTALTNALNEIRRNDTYKNCSLKIAVWHHPINSPFEDRIKDSNFLQRLAINDFRLFLHGHVHKAENNEFRYDMNVDGRKLHRICAGTFGAPTKELNTGIPWQYNLLKIEANKVTVHTRKRETENGAWEGDFRWRYGQNQSLSYYQISLNYIKEKSETSLNSNNNQDGEDEVSTDKQNNKFVYIDQRSGGNYFNGSVTIKNSDIVGGNQLQKNQ